MADKAAPEAKRSLRYIGGDVRDDKTRKNETGEDPGRSDLTFILAGIGSFVEVKNGERGWTTRSKNPDKCWTQQQREWAKRKVFSPRPTTVWMWISVGPDNPNYSRVKYLPRRTWLVPFEKALWVATTIEGNGQNTLPYKVMKGTRSFFRERNLSCETVFDGYELEWRGNKLWSIPIEHPFRKMFDAEA